MTHPGHVDIVEDDDSLRNTIQDLLIFAGFAVRAWRDASSFLDNLPEVAPAVAVVDMRIPSMTGVQLHAELLRRGRTMPVIYISGESTVPQSIAAMKLGAVDFLVKPFSREALVKAVVTGLERDRNQMRQMIARSRFDEAVSRLSRREIEAMNLLLQGYSNPEIAQELTISLSTAKQYKSQIMRKLGVRSLSQLMKLSRARECPDVVDARRAP